MEQEAVCSWPVNLILGPNPFVVLRPPDLFAILVTLQIFYL